MALVYRSRRRSRQPDFENGDDSGTRFRTGLSGGAFMQPWRFFRQASLQGAVAQPDGFSLKAVA